MKAFVIFFSLALAFPACASGQSWDSVRSLRSGEQIRIVDTDGTEHKGTVASVSADAISLTAHDHEESIERARVRKVKVRSGSRRLRNTLIGVGVGLAVGLVVDATIGAYLRNEGGEPTRPLNYVVPIGVFGGLTAAMPGYRTVYRVR